MKKVWITAIIYLVLATALSIYLGFFYQSTLPDEWKEQGIRGVYSDEKEFKNLIQQDGKLVAFGKLTGSIDMNEVDFEGIEYQGEDKDAQIKGLKKELGKEYLYLKVQAATLQKKVERKMRKAVDKSKDEEYEYYDDISYISNVYDEQKYFAKATFNGVPVEWSQTELIQIISLVKDTDLPFTKKDGQHVLEAEYIESPFPIWLECEIINEEMQNIKLHSDMSPFAANAREALEKDSPITVIIGVFAFMGILCGITIWVLKKFFD